MSFNKETISYEFVTKSSIPPSKNHSCAFCSFLLLRLLSKFLFFFVHELHIWYVNITPTHSLSNRHHLDMIIKMFIFFPFNSNCCLDIRTHVCLWEPRSVQQTVGVGIVCPCVCVCVSITVNAGLLACCLVWYDRRYPYWNLTYMERGFVHVSFEKFYRKNWCYTSVFPSQCVSVCVCVCYYEYANTFFVCLGVVWFLFCYYYCVSFVWHDILCSRNKITIQHSVGRKKDSYRSSCGRKKNE